MIYNLEVEDEECFSKMLYEVEKRKFAIPVEVYEEFERFIDDELAPMVYEEGFFMECTIGEYDEEGVFQADQEKATTRVLANFLETIYDIEQNLNYLLENKVRPYLC